MVRKILVVDHRLNHPILSLYLLVACMAASIAIVSSLCALTRKKSPSPPATEEKTENSNVVISPAVATETETTTQPQDEEQPPLPPPPRMLRTASQHFDRSNSTAANGKLSSSTSVRMQKMGSKQWSKREDRHRDKKLNKEDSILNKKIILGEKCQVPNEDETSSHRPKTPPRSLSRQESRIDKAALPRTLSRTASRVDRAPRS